MKTIEKKNITTIAASTPGMVYIFVEGFCVNPQHPVRKEAMEHALKDLGYVVIPNHINLAVSVAKAMGNILDLSHGIDKNGNSTTVIFVQANNGEYRVTWSMGAPTVEVLPWW